MRKRTRPGTEASRRAAACQTHQTTKPREQMDTEEVEDDTEEREEDAAESDDASEDEGSDQEGGGDDGADGDDDEDRLLRLGGAVRVSCGLLRSHAPGTVFAHVKAYNFALFDVCLPSAAILDEDLDWSGSTEQLARKASAHTAEPVRPGRVCPLREDVRVWEQPRHDAAGLWQAKEDPAAR
ncbi:hypothetical protein PybrP1_012650 [[Pythium] brassicae (nom. inval.)]|nr:hypothetical protein PybrP1_012650 [[Pythium] brassicae (nom. inval.)]